ncbi:hypothetical protein L3X38_030003 [Prunus dulcis]|nr:hypothetical protein L3X38_030003 [Prunus dulcis]
MVDAKAGERPRGVKKLNSEYIQVIPRASKRTKTKTKLWTTTTSIQETTPPKASTEKKQKEKKKISSASSNRPTPITTRTLEDKMPPVVEPSTSKNGANWKMGF